MPSDEELIRAFAGGSRDALDMLARRYEQELLDLLDKRKDSPLTDVLKAVFQPSRGARPPGGQAGLFRHFPSSCCIFRSHKLLRCS